MLTQTHELIREQQEYFEFWSAYADRGQIH
jgi:hypothetical protein